jgi:hypothetical protein
MLGANMQVPQPDGDESQKSSDSSEDFGDAEFDTAMVDALEISQREPQPRTKESVAPQADTDIETVRPQVEVQDTGTYAVDAGSEDEFGLDEDLFAADLEHVASLYDSREEEMLTGDQFDHDTRPNTHAPAAPVITVIEDDSDDDFGDDIDVDELAAAEVAATQGNSTVCRLSPYA